MTQRASLSERRRLADIRVSALIDKEACLDPGKGRCWGGVLPPSHHKTREPSSYPRRELPGFSFLLANWPLELLQPVLLEAAFRSVRQDRQAFDFARHAGLADRAAGMFPEREIAAHPTGTVVVGAYPDGRFFLGDRFRLLLREMNDQDLLRSCLGPLLICDGAARFILPFLRFPNESAVIAGVRSPWGSSANFEPRADKRP